MGFAGDVVKGMKKWLSVKTNLGGIVGFVVIMLVLAIDFSYWADTIGAISPGDDDDDGGGVILPPSNATLEVMYDSGNLTGSLPHGHYNRGFIDPRDTEGETYMLATFDVPDNATEIYCTVDGDPGGERPGGGDMNDMDLYLYEPGNSNTGNEESADYVGATESIHEEISVQKKSLPTGTWTLRLDCFSGQDVSFTYQMIVSGYPNGTPVAEPLEEEEE